MVGLRLVPNRLPQHCYQQIRRPLNPALCRQILLRSLPSHRYQQLILEVRSHPDRRETCYIKPMTLALDFQPFQDCQQFLRFQMIQVALTVGQHFPLLDLKN